VLRSEEIHGVRREKEEERKMGRESEGKKEV
jgi:hypothetical protein